MKVLHLLLTGQPGGIEVLVHNIATHSHNINIAYFIFDGGPIANLMDNSEIPVVVANTPRYRWNNSIHKFVQYCADEQVGVVVNHMDSPVACAHILSLKKNIPSIKIFSYLHCDVRNVVRGVKGKVLYLPFIKAMHKCCEKIVAISEFVRSAGIEAYNLPRDKVEVIYNAIDTSIFQKRTCTSPVDRMELIFVGRLIREKGIHLLIDALRRLPKNMKVHATIVGGGIEYNALLEQVDRLHIQDRISFLGQRMDIPSLLHKADFFVHPAICQEGFGITLIEAMATGMPCIASCGGAIPEIIDETNGLIFELGSVDDLERKICLAYQLYQTEMYNAMSDKARERACAFDINTMVRRLEKLYLPV